MANTMVVLEIWNLGLFSVGTGQGNDEACNEVHGVPTDHLPILNHVMCGTTGSIIFINEDSIDDDDSPFVEQLNRQISQPGRSLAKVQSPELRLEFTISLLKICPTISLAASTWLRTSLLVATSCTPNTYDLDFTNNK